MREGLYMLQRGLSRLEPEPGGRKLDKMREPSQACVKGLVEEITRGRRCALTLHSFSISPHL